MKKTLLTLAIISFYTVANAQVKVNQNAANSAINTSSAFMDASSSPLWNGTTNQGKGMLYPRVDLVNYTTMSHAGPFNASNNPNYFDGLLVFNTATGIAGIGADSVFPGYYYYRNTTTTANGGHWVSLKGIKGDDGSIGPIGPQGVAGATGATGAAGTNGAVGSTGAAGTSGTNGVRIGYAQSGTWVCPAGVTQIIIELWGGGGGGQQSCPTGGASGGKGGYTKQTYTVVTGNSYIVVVGLGGTILPFVGDFANCTSANRGPGGNGGNSSFDNLIIAYGGIGGNGGINGADGTITNWQYGVSGSSGTPGTVPYVPNTWTQNPPTGVAAGGVGSGFFCYSIGYSFIACSATPGENGYCIISY